MIIDLSDYGTVCTVQAQDCSASSRRNDKIRTVSIRNAERA